MISFAACFALTISAYATGGSALASSVRNLINEAATVLERVGNVTRHRNGLSVMYGKYLKQIVKRAATGEAEAIAATMTRSVKAATPMESSSLGQNTSFLDQQDIWAEMLQFSAMSDDQIVQALNQPGTDFDPSFGGLSWDDMTNFEWLHWPEVGF